VNYPKTRRLNLFIKFYIDELRYFFWVVGVLLFELQTHKGDFHHARFRKRLRGRANFKLERAQGAREARPVFSVSRRLLGRFSEEKVSPYLVPLGEGVFKNSKSDIFDSMPLAYLRASEKYDMEGVDVYILTCDKNPS